MSRFFNMESPVFQFLSRLADLMILNVIFLITCIPIVTIGAAWTSLSYMTMKMIRNEESYIVRGYFKSFKQNFKQSTIMWLIVLVAGFVLYMDYRIMSVMTDVPGHNIILIGIYAVTLLSLFVLQYLFPLVAKFYNSTKNMFRNALLMSIRHLPFTVIMTVIFVGSGIVTFINGYTITYGLLIWIMGGFAIVSLTNSWFMVRIFDKYIPEATEEKEEEAEEAAAAEEVAELPENE